MASPSFADSGCEVWRGRSLRQIETAPKINEGLTGLFEKVRGASPPRERNVFHPGMELARLVRTKPPRGPKVE